MFVYAALQEIVDLDLILLESVLMGDEDNPAEVKFSVKELLVDIRGAITQLGETTKNDLSSAERRLHDRIVLVENASKERAEAVEATAKALALSNAERISTLETVNNGRLVKLETESTDNKIRWARVGGIAAIGSFVGGGGLVALLTALDAI